MKTLFKVAFLCALVCAASLNSVAGILLSCAGLLIACADSVPAKVSAAFFNVVPGKYMVPRDLNAYEEVPMMSRAEKALFDQLITLKRANPVTDVVIGQGGISFDPISYYIRAIVTGGAGTQTIVDNSIIQTIGITNIPNGAALPQFYNFCFDRIAVRYASVNTAAANVAAMTGWSSIRSAMPAALGNGHLVIYSNQNKILETPVSDFTSVAAITGGGERDYDGGVLEKPRFFLELINMQIDLSYAKNQVMPSAANNTYAVEVMLHGVQARLKA